MVKKTSVRKHKRRIGRKKVTIRRHNRRVKSSISKKQRKLFDAMATLPYEVGGQLDFENGKLQNTKTHFGSGSTLEFDWDPDYEVGYHTHPNVRGTSMMPSYDDIVSMRETNEKEQVILHKNLALSVAEKSRFRKVPLRTIRKLSNAMGRDFKKGMSDRRLYRKYKPIFKREMGLDMKWHNPHMSIRLDSEAI